MAQYTSTVTGFGGIVTNSILNSVTNTQTITVTAPTGQAVTITVDANDINSNFDNIVSNLSRQLSEQGADVGLRGITQGLSQTTTDVNQQKQTATGVAIATGNPPPAEKQAIPVNPADDNVPVPPTENIPQDDTLQTPPETDEFDGIDTQIENNANALQEPPQLSDEEVNDYFNQLQNEQIENTDTTIDDGSDPGVYYENDGTASTSTTFYENDGTPSFGVAQGLTSSLFNTRSQATQQDSTNAMAKGDWRVRLSLGPGANYLYKGDNAGILAPLRDTGGVLFPYTPSINVNYAASYDTSELVHSNYKNFQYRSSSVDSISITCDFTAQDTKEARYVLAVIHFFRSVTKMFYGQDQNPKNGTPPPLCYLTGMGAFQFDRHPLAITAFNLALPTDVDYIRAGSVNDNPGVSADAEFFRDNTYSQSVQNLLQGQGGLAPGGITPAPQFKTRPTGTTEATYVPTKIGISISAIPINSRNSISNNFSLRDYGSGQLLRGSKNRTGTGMW